MAIDKKLLIVASMTSIVASQQSYATRFDDLVKENNVHAIMEWAPRYEHGEGIDQSAYHAIQLYCIAAVQHKNPNAMRQLGWMYANGRGIKQNDAQAFAWLNKAAKAGCGVSKRLSNRIVPSEQEQASCVLPEPPESIINDQDLIALQQPDPRRIGHNVRLLDRKNPSRKDIDAIVRAYSQQKNIDHRLVHAVIERESSYNPQAVSSAGAQGLMQLMPATAKRFKVKDPFDPVQNIRGGVTYLRWLLDEFNGDLEKAIASYFAGENAIKKHNGIPKHYPKTRNYVKKVIQTYMGSVL